MISLSIILFTALIVLVFDIWNCDKNGFTLYYRGNEVMTSTLFTIANLPTN